MGINMHIFGELMSIELKYKFKYHLTVAVLAALALFFGWCGVAYRLEGMIMLPLTASFIAALICVEKRRIASLAVSAILIGAEFIVGLSDYHTLSALCSVLVAVIISVFFTKKMDKSDSAMLSMLVTTVVILAMAAIYFISTTEASTLYEAYEHFLALYADFKDSVITSVISAAQSSGADTSGISTEYMHEVFDAYLHCIVALVAILAFMLVGLAYKLFTGLMRICSAKPEQTAFWQFIPSVTFAYFYFALAFLSLFSINTESVLSVSVVNLYLIFTFVFSYVGYRYTVALISQKGRSKRFSRFTIIALTVLFSSIALQILAAIGAFITAKYSKIAQDIKSDKH